MTIFNEYLFNKLKNQPTSNKDSSIRSRSIADAVTRLDNAIPTLSALKNKTNINGGHREEITRAVDSVADALSAIGDDSSRNVRLDACKRITISQDDCVGVICTRITMMNKILSSRGIESCMERTKNEIVSESVRAFVHSHILKKVYDYGVGRWFTAKYSVHESYNNNMIFNIPFDLKRSDEHLVNTWLNLLADDYGLTEVSSVADRHLVRMVGYDNKPLSIDLFTHFNEITQSNLHDQNGKLLEDIDVGAICDLYYAAIAELAQSERKTTINLAREKFHLHRRYQSSVQASEDIKPAILLHLIAYLGHTSVRQMIYSPDCTNRWIENTASEWMSLLPPIEDINNPSTKSGFSCLQTELSQFAIKYDMQLRESPEHEILKTWLNNQDTEYNGAIYFSPSNVLSNGSDYSYIYSKQLFAKVCLACASYAAAEGFFDKQSLQDQSYTWLLCLMDAMDEDCSAINHMQHYMARDLKPVLNPQSQSDLKQEILKNKRDLILLNQTKTNQNQAEALMSKFTEFTQSDSYIPSIFQPDEGKQKNQEWLQGANRVFDLINQGQYNQNTEARKIRQYIRQAIQSQNDDFATAISSMDSRFSSLPAAGSRTEFLKRNAQTLIASIIEGMILQPNQSPRLCALFTNIAEQLNITSIETPQALRAYLDESKPYNLMKQADKSIFAPVIPNTEALFKLTQKDLCKIVNCLNNTKQPARVPLWRRIVRLLHWLWLCITGQRPLYVVNHRLWDTINHSERQPPAIRI